MQLIWVTDPHLNFARHDVWEAWINSIRLVAGDHLLITGDITEADDIAWQLKRIQSCLSIPVSFVLGNHDYYGSCVSKVREEIRQLTSQSSGLNYLSENVIVALSDGWGLCGSDGWADGGYGDALNSPVRLNDFRRIRDFGGFDLSEDLRIMKELAKDAADSLRSTLTTACKEFKRILIATHIPPYREACWYQGQITNDDWAPYFVSRIMGETITEFATLYPSHLFHVLCGHTHHSGVTRMTENLTIWTGAAEYSQPSIQDVIDMHTLANRLQT
jgi:Icc protein